jgi:hypothetical protein
MMNGFAMKVALGSTVLLALVATGCNDRDRGRGATGDAAVGSDAGMTSDSATGGDAAPGDATTPPGDGATGTDTGTPPTGCSIDVKFLGVPTDPACDETWTEAGATLAFVNTTADDCSAGRCSFMTEPSTEEVWLYPGRLEVRLQSGTTCGRVEVDIDDYCGAGCTKAFAYASGTEVARAENTGSRAETLVLTSTTAIDTVAVSSCEGQVTELRFR